MGKHFVVAVFAVFAFACGVPQTSDVPSSTASRSDALETHGDKVVEVHLDIGETLEISVDLTDPQIIERASRPLVEEMFFYDAFGGGGGCHCGCPR